MSHPHSPYYSDPQFIWNIAVCIKHCVLPPLLPNMSEMGSFKFKWVIYYLVLSKGHIRWVVRISSAPIVFPSLEEGVRWRGQPKNSQKLSLVWRRTELFWPHLKILILNSISPFLTFSLIFLCSFPQIFVDISIFYFHGGQTPLTAHPSDQGRGDNFLTNLTPWGKPGPMIVSDIFLCW